MSNFAKWLRNGSRKKSDLKYEPIIYGFEARDLDVLNM